MPLTTTSIKQLTAWLRTAPTDAAEYIVNLVDETETRLAAAEGDTGDIDARLTTAEGDIDTLQSGLTTANANITAVTTKANVQRFPVLAAADAAAADVVGETTFGVARAAGNTGVAGIDLVFSGNITASDTDYATITVRRRTGAGAGTAAVVATITTQITGGLGNVTGHALIQPTTTATAVIAGDRFTYQVEKAGAFVQLPAMSLTVVETLT
jgi:hypothetical protein